MTNLNHNCPADISTRVSGTTVTVHFTEPTAARWNYVLLLASGASAWVPGGCGSSCMASSSEQPAGSSYSLAISHGVNGWGQWSDFSPYTVGGGAIVGVVEGFYWSNAHAVHGVSGQYTHAQRRRLLRVLQDRGLQAFVYAPQTADTISPWPAVDSREWRATADLARSLGVRLVYGLRPGWVDGTTPSRVQDKLDELIAAGVGEYVLAWDDTAGAGTLDQMQAQGDLIMTHLSNYRSSECALLAIVPAAYHAKTDTHVPAGHNTTWESQLLLLDGGVDTRIPFVLAGPSVTPLAVSVPDSFPRLSSGRPFILWDNWCAVDTSTRIPWALPRNRDPALFRAPFGGVLLNLAFPPERVIHAIFALALHGAVDAATEEQAAAYWAGFLAHDRFITDARRPAVQAALLAAIRDDKFYSSIGELTAAVPALEGVFL
mmetsp:Transcript_44049/g.111018  ORF Transcript_44049/g.111018 Transcript_44049/m.111018 type:complete len:431 (+) Transcript_44049:6-1298(+)